MTHGLDSCIPVLRRWAALSKKPLPSDWRTFERNNATEALNIRTRDPEIVDLLSGQAGASLRADALSGAISPVAPTQQEIDKAQRSDRLQFLANAKPFGGRKPDGSIIEPNITLQLELCSLDASLADRLRKEAETSLQSNAPDASRLAAHEASIRRTVIASKNGISGRIN